MKLFLLCVNITGLILLPAFTDEVTLKIFYAALNVLNLWLLGFVGDTKHGKSVEWAGIIVSCVIFIGIPILLLVEAVRCGISPAQTECSLVTHAFLESLIFAALASVPVAYLGGRLVWLVNRRR